MAIEEPYKIPFDVAHFGVIQYDRQKRDAFERQLGVFIERIEQSVNHDSPVKEFLSRNPIRLARMASDVGDTPFHWDRILDHAKNEIFLIGQNLSSLAQNVQVRNELFDWLRSTPDAKLRMMIVDRSKEVIVNALSTIIDRRIKVDLYEADGLLRDWQKEWNEISNSDGRMEIRVSDNIGNVSFTFIDGSKADGMALIRPVLHQTAPGERPCFWVTRAEDDRAFAVYWNKQDDCWKHAQPLT